MPARDNSAPSGPKNGSRSTLVGRRAIVTGAAAGIGCEVAAEFARRGAIVVALDRQHDALELLRSELDGADGSIHPYACDLADTDEFDGILSYVQHEFGGLDILANVAGITRWKAWPDVTVDDWEQIMAVNARAMLFLTQKAAPLMATSGGGAVVTISSIAGKGFRRTSSVAYAGSKAAVIAMSRVLSDALAPFNIRVNCICPGPVETGFLAEGMRIFSGTNGDSEATEHQQWLAQVPLGLAAQPADIAELVCYLAADTGRCVTGQAWNVDGGMVFD
jgi:NAD(P)-dependent dehydrogenase (short-subunit alcohol dehydrogenase family)